MKLTALAKGQPCMVRGPRCNHDPATTVAAHFRSLRLGAGLSRKPPDLFIAFACSACHDWIDGRRYIEGYGIDQAREAHMMGVLETQKWMLEHGHVVIA